MQCERARELLSLESERREPSAELQAHLSGCEACSQAQAAEHALDRMLALDTVQAPGPGFDTRFFARLETERAGRRKRRSWFLAFALLPAAAALAAGMLWLRPGRPAGLEPKDLRAKLPELEAALPEALANEEELELLRELELVEELEIVSKLDELEDFELLQALDAEELEQIAGEAP